MFLIGSTADGQPRTMFGAPDVLAVGMAAPDRARAATCETCHQTIYQLPDGGVWTLGRAPWWCFPDPELIDVLAQAHRPQARGSSGRPGAGGALQ